MFPHHGNAGGEESDRMRRGKGEIIASSTKGRVAGCLFRVSVLTARSPLLLLILGYACV